MPIRFFATSFALQGDDRVGDGDGGVVVGVFVFRDGDASLRGMVDGRRCRLGLVLLLFSLFSLSLSETDDRLIGDDRCILGQF